MKPYLRLRQICVAAPALEPAVQQIRDLFGLEVCFRDENVAKYGLVNALFVFGHAFLEIVAPTREGTAAGRFIERSKGVGGYMAIFDCDDPLARRARAEAMGVRIAHVLDYPTFFGSQLHPRDCRATMLEFDHTVDGEKLDGHYHPAGPHWQQFQRLDRVSGIPMIEVRTPDPSGLASFWAGLMDRLRSGQGLLRTNPIGRGPRTPERDYGQRARSRTHTPACRGTGNAATRRRNLLRRDSDQADRGGVTRLVSRMLAGPGDKPLQPP